METSTQREARIWAARQINGEELARAIFESGVGLMVDGVWSGSAENPNLIGFRYVRVHIPETGLMVRVPIEMARDFLARHPS